MCAVVLRLPALTRVQCSSLATKSDCQAQQPGCAWQKNICVQVPSECASPRPPVSALTLCAF